MIKPFVAMVYREFPKDRRGSLAKRLLANLSRQSAQQPEWRSSPSMAKVYFEGELPSLIIGKKNSGK